MELVKFKKGRREAHHVVSIYRGLVFVTCPHYTNSPPPTTKAPLGLATPNNQLLHRLAF